MNELENLGDDTYFDDDIVEDDPQNPDQNQEPDKQVQDNDDVHNDDSDDTSDVITEYLRSKGIDASAIKMQNENGETEDFNFKDLTREEQLQILDYNPASQEEPELAEDEEKLLNILRQNNMSVQDYLNAYKKHVIEQYQSESDPVNTETYSVDDYTDEELFVADLKDKIPDLTEEEATAALEQESQNPDLFKKKMAGLRAEYQQREQAVKEQEEYRQQQVEAQQAAQFESLIVDTIQRNNSIDLGDTSLELSEDDMNEIASFILDSDAAGVRHLAKALNDPRTLVEMAWWALKGHDALNQVTQYYKRQIADARKSAKAAATSRQKPTTVITKPKSQNESKSSQKDLFEDFI